MSDKHYLANLGSVGLTELRIICQPTGDAIRWHWVAVSPDCGHRMTGHGSAPVVGTSLDDVLRAVGDAIEEAS
jgi:hypothetical protein